MSLLGLTSFSLITMTGERGGGYEREKERKGVVVDGDRATEGEQDKRKTCKQTQTENIFSIALTSTSAE